MKKTVVELDLVGYSTICDNFEQGLDVNSAAQLNQQIQSFVDAGLKAVNASRDQHVMQTTGDGAIVVFDTAADAHRFAQAVHEATREHNRHRKQPLAKRVFRIGAASGDIVMEPKAGGGFEIAGMTIARAVRLEAKAQPGGFLVDEATFESLGEEQKQRYASKEVITGKRDEEFEAYACQLNPDGPKDAAFFTSQTKRETSPSVPEHRQTGSFRADISRIVKYAPERLVGREDELKLLSDAWEKAVRGEKKRPHVLTFVALGGEGKTSLVAKWAADLAHQDWPGCDAVFAWSFYSQGTREQTAVSSDLFLAEALTFFGDATMAKSAQGAFDKGRRLAQLIGERRALLILDGVEPLQYPPASPTPGELKDQGISALLKGLAAMNHGLCVVTTRYSIADLRAYWQATAPEMKLMRLSKAAGVALLQRLGVKGTQPEFEKLVEEVKGHALTLNLLGSYLRDSHAGDIRKRDLVKLSEADSEEQGGHAFHVMDAYVKSFESEGEKGKRALAILRLLGLFDRPVTTDCLNALWKGEAIAGLTEPLIDVSEAQRNMSLKRLEDAKLLTVNRDAAGTLLSLDAHPLLREYFGKQLRENNLEAWRAAHRRLYEHLCATTKEGDEPTLEDLQPLYQAVAHGCQAGLQQGAREEVYQNRILKRSEYYSSKKLGALGSNLGAVACFFETPWSRVSPALTEPAQAWLLSEAAYYLRASGRLTEALEPMRAGLKMIVKQKNLKNAAISAENVSELNLTLGKVDAAVADAEAGVNYADESREEVERRDNRVVHADALHHEGRRDEAQARFREAEEMQKKRQPDYPLLYSGAGFRYCDLLLTEAERAAWQSFLQIETQDSELETAAASCRAVSERAAQTLKWVSSENWLLDIALDHLTLGRAALFAEIIGKSEVLSAQSEVESAVIGFRRAGTQDHLPSGLLTRAWLRFLIGPRIGPESAQADLDEAWEIAERGPMKLFMADIHLYRARLCHAVKPYPWNKNPDGTDRGPKDDLKDARNLIEQCGYWRRKEELEDAEAAAKNW